MSEFGTDLRKERESKGVSLEAISEATKIGSRYLVALETGHFSDLPGGIFNKGIVRSYVRFVGLDESAWVNRFLTACQTSGQFPEDELSWMAFAQNVGKSRPRAKKGSELSERWTSVAVVVVLLVALGWFVWDYVSDRPTHTTAQQTAVTTWVGSPAAVHASYIRHHRLR
jgi:cytoskeleton protein RodZ